MQLTTRERDKAASPGTGTIDVTPLLATWVNFDAASRGIVRAEIARRGNALLLRPFGASESGLLSWDEAECTPLSDDVSHFKASGLITSFDLGFQRVLVVGYVNRGLLTLEAASIFTDGSPRARYMTRQHFYRLPR